MAAPTRYGAVDSKDEMNGHPSSASAAPAYNQNDSDGELFPAGHGGAASQPLTFASRLSGDDTESLIERSRAARRTARYGICLMALLAVVVLTAFFVAFTWGGDSSSSSASSTPTNAVSLPSSTASAPTHHRSSSPSSATPAYLDHAPEDNVDNADAAAAAASDAQHNNAMGVTSTTVGDDYPRVKVGVYYDSYCPFSQKFLVGTLRQVWNAEGVRDIIDLQLVPFGNVNEFVDENGRYNFTCQHGPKECEGNMLQSCAVQILGNAAAYEYVYCMLKTTDPNANAARCAEQQHIDYGGLRSCVKLHGDEALHRMGYLTGHLYPAHEYVPWITLNSFPIEDPSLLLKMICKLHLGPRPAGCSAKLTAEKSGYTPRPDGEYNDGY